MEAPEKIWINSSIDLPKLNGIIDKDSVQYIRTDTFIEKILEWLRKGGERGDAYIVTEYGEEIIDFVKLAEDLKNHIKENKV